MAYNGPQIVIWFIILTTLLIFYALNALLSGGSDLRDLKDDGTFQSTWVFRLSLNLLGYSTIFIPGFLIYKYVGVSKFLERSGSGCLPRVVRACIVGGEVLPSDVVGDSPIRSLRQDVLLLVFCFVGLQGTYLTWGLLQEKVMTQEYTNSKGEVKHFKDSQFLVFVNRILAFTFSAAYILFSRQPRHVMPLYKYAYSSFSNIMSSWCQYEALKYVSFPTQVLAKASKLIPVMIMGKLVTKQKYEYYEYVTAIIISTGMAFFLLSSAETRDNTVTTMSGVILLASYMAFDSFTSNWQGALFTQYKISPVQMMCGVNLFSCLFTAVSLFQQGAFSTCLQFMIDFPKFTIDCLLLSISSGAGQLFIFFTISTFGPVVFTIIMTVRQGLAIFLSCLIYNHPLKPLGVLGVVLVFIAIFLRIYCSQRQKDIRRRLQSISASKV